MTDKLTPRIVPETDRIEEECDLDMGQWYWVQGYKDIPNPNYVPENEDDEVDDEEYEWNDYEDDDEDEEDKGPNPRRLTIEYEYIACVVSIGSNYAQLQEPSKYDNSVRIHFDNWNKRTRRELNPESVIGERILHFQKVIQTKMDRVKQITAALGVSSRIGIEQAPEDNSTALVALSGTADPKKYEKALVHAKDIQLPELFKEIKSANQSLAIWMNASVIPLEAQVGQMQEVVGVIKNRIFNVSLYAGLTERVTQFVDGAPADFADKLHIMQRKCFMDEECLANYKTGGMDFDNIEDFDAWIAEPENRDRLLPFPRTMVAFQVRRREKERDSKGKFYTVWINMQMADADKLTFLYFRNGEQLSRMNCDLEFGLKIFPSRDVFDPSSPMMFKMYSDSRVDEVITLREFEALCQQCKDMDAEHKQQMKIRKQWIKKNLPKKWWGKTHWDLHGKKYDEWFTIIRNAPYGGNRASSPIHPIDPQQWEPLDPSSVHYDDAMKEITDRVQYYNRVAMIVQGLYDRSPIFHPHPPVKLWTGEGFQEAVELVYDGSNVIYAGKKPDFEAFRRQCNTSIEASSIVVGQELFWETKEAEKECARLDASWRSTDYRPPRYQPYGNDGPGYIAHIARWHKNSKRATFKWTRKRQKCINWNHSYDDNLQCSLTVPVDKLFNVSAYELGDFRQFFADPRTRQEYLKWAPLLLAAEEFHAGNKKMKPQKPEEI